MKSETNVLNDPRGQPHSSTSSEYFNSAIFTTITDNTKGIEGSTQLVQGITSSKAFENVCLWVRRVDQESTYWLIIFFFSFSAKGNLQRTFNDPHSQASQVSSLSKGICPKFQLVQTYSDSFRDQAV